MLFSGALNGLGYSSRDEKQSWDGNIPWNECSTAHIVKIPDHFCGLVHFSSPS